MVNPAEVPLVSMRLSIKTDLRRMSVAVALSAGPLSAGTTEERDPENGLLSWTWREQGVSIQLVQRLPDQTRAFFLGRGFQLADADLVAKFGDYNWGMISFGLTPGTQFDLSLMLRADNKPVFGKIPTLIRAEDGNGSAE